MMRTRGAMIVAARGAARGAPTTAAAQSRFVVNVPIRGGAGSSAVNGHSVGTFKGFDGIANSTPLVYPGPNTLRVSWNAAVNPGWVSVGTSTPGGKAQSFSFPDTRAFGSPGLVPNSADQIQVRYARHKSGFKNVVVLFSNGRSPASVTFNRPYWSRVPITRCLVPGVGGAAAGRPTTHAVPRRDDAQQCPTTHKTADEDADRRG